MKKALATVLTMGLVLSMTACGGNKTQDAATTTESTEEVVEETATEADAEASEETTEDAADAEASEDEEADTEAEAEGEDAVEAEEEKAEEEVENLLPIDDPEYHKEDFDDLYDDFDDDDDLTEVEDLDEILDKEGIEITDGDTVGNIMEMYNAGFSIIEISKVMNVGVSEVKYVIDSHQGDY